MKGLAVMLMSLALSVTGASAQALVTTGPQQNTPFGPDPIIRVTVMFRAAIEGTDARTAPDAKAQETARRSLYDMASSECTALSEAFKAECRLGTLQVTQFFPVSAPNLPPAAPALNATATYELKPKSAASPQ
jgi:hypothetical protein